MDPEMDPEHPLVHVAETVCRVRDGVGVSRPGTDCDLMAAPYGVPLVTILVTPDVRAAPMGTAGKGGGGQALLSREETAEDVRRVLSGRS